MEEDLRLAIGVAEGPVNPAVQFRLLLVFCRDHEWAFLVAWRWSFERVRWPHDTTARREWKQIMGDRCDDPRVLPARQREMWQRAYERGEVTRSEQAGGKLMVA